MCLMYIGHVAVFFCLASPLDSKEQHEQQEQQDQKRVPHGLCRSSDLGHGKKGLLGN